jgi:hypothetical protein
VAVRAHDLALLDLGEDALPTPVGEIVPDLKRFLAQVIEFENDRVALPAVDAGVVPEVLEQVDRPLVGLLAFTGPRLVDVPLSVSGVMLPLVCRPARAAHVVPLAPRLASPRKLLKRLGLATPAAPSVRYEVEPWHEHMFP